MGVGGIGSGGPNVADVGATDDVEAPSGAGGDGGSPSVGAATTGSMGAPPPASDLGDLHAQMLQLKVGAGGAGGADGASGVKAGPKISDADFAKRAAAATNQAIPDKHTKDEDTDMSGVRKAVAGSIAKLSDPDNRSSSVECGDDISDADLKKMAASLNKQFGNGTNALPVGVEVTSDPRGLKFVNKQPPPDQKMDFGK